VIDNEKYLKKVNNGSLKKDWEKWLKSEAILKEIESVF
jgi:hypothetical protein